MEGSKSAADIKRKLLKLDFQDLRATWEGYHDDRRIFCNLYDMLMAALDEMESVTSNLIWVAFNHQFKEDYEMLGRIRDNFAGKAGEPGGAENRNPLSAAGAGRV